MSEQDETVAHPIEIILSVGWLGTGLIAVFVDARFQPLPYAFAITYFASIFWRKQNEGLITRDGDPHIFWFALVSMYGMAVLNLYFFAGHLGLIP